MTESRHAAWDLTVSNRHVRIHTIVYQRDIKSDYEALVFAEDVSRNGTFLNEALMGRDKGGFLLSDGDVLRLSPRFRYQFVADERHSQPVKLDLMQEKEAQVWQLHDEGPMGLTLRQHFKDQFLITPRQLGSGGFGSVHMALDASQINNVQYACKIIDLRKYRKPVTTRFGRWNNPARAAEVDQNLQMQKLAKLTLRKDDEDRLRRIRTQSQREAEILKDLNHVG